ncbi:Thiol-disulfide oxidoreductase ResA [compost metagenome]
MYQLYKDSNFTIIGVSLDAIAEKNEWLEAIRKDKLTWPQVSDLKAENHAAKLYGVTGIPQNLLIDPDGRIIAKDLKGAALEKKLSEILGKHN